MAYTKPLDRDYKEPTHLYPGQELKEFLEQVYLNEGLGYLKQADEDLICDDELNDLIYFNVINYILRRLITAGQFIYRLYNIHGEGRVRIELRKYLSDYTRYDYDQVERILNYLLRIIRNSDDDFSQRDKKTASNQVKAFNWGCYICGKEMDFTHANPDNSYKFATADHKWPRMFGGVSEIENLRYACQSCNGKYKRDFIDYNDYHFKEIAFVITSFDDYIAKARNRSYEAAIFAKTDYKCTVCNQPAYRVGELHIGRIDLEDSWHYLNLIAYCENHKPE